MSHQLVLLSPYTFPGAYPLTLADEDMAAWLNGYTALWHPALLWQAEGPPRVESPYDHESPRERTIYAVPETPPNYLPEDWKERLKRVGSMSFTATPEREATLASVKAMLEADGATLGWREALDAPADMLSLFFGLGFGSLMLASFAEAMERESPLEAAAFWKDVQASIEAMGSEESPTPNEASPGLPSTRGEGPKERGVPTDSEIAPAVPRDGDSPLSVPGRESLVSAGDSVSSEASPPSLGDNPSTAVPLPGGERGAEPVEDAWLGHLGAAARKLLSARETLYPVKIHWLDLHLLNEDSFKESLPAAMELGVPVNLVASGKTLETLARTQPEKFAILKTLVQSDLVELCGGNFHDADDPLLPIDSQIWNLREGLDISRRLLGTDLRIFARRRFGFSPRTPHLLAAHGLHKLLFLVFDDTGIPTFHSPVIAWSAPDGKQIDAFARPPKPADKPETFFNLANTWYKTTREDHHAVVAIVHSSTTAPWHRDLVALAKLAPVLGDWTIFSKYLGSVSPGEYPATPVADDFHYDLLSERTTAKLPDPVSGFGKHLKIRRRIDACWTYAALHRALAGESDTLDVSDLASVERVFETPPALGSEPGGLAEIETHIAATLAARLQSNAVPNRPGVMLLNPCGFARRYALELDGATAPIPVEGIVKACQLDGSTNRVVVEVPPLGFAWLPRSGPPGTPAMKARMQLAEPKTFTIRNEFFEAEVDVQTGGLKAIRDYKTRMNRLGQKLVFNPGSRMLADKVEVTSTGPALGEIVSEGRLLGEQDQELATFKQRIRVWFGRPLLEMRIELTPKQPAAGYPWHAYFGCRFAWRDERAYLYRGQGGESFLSTHPRPQSPDFLDLRVATFGTAIFPGGLPFHQRQEGRMLDVILVPEGETATTFDLGIALDRDQPILTSWGVASPLAVVPTEKGPPHVGASGWLFHFDLPSLLLTRMTPGPGHGLTAQLIECSGFSAHSEILCVRNPKSATMTNAVGQSPVTLPVDGDKITLEVVPHDLVHVRVEF